LNRSVLEEAFEVFTGAPLVAFEVAMPLLLVSRPQPEYFIVKCWIAYFNLFQGKIRKVLRRSGEKRVRYREREEFGSKRERRSTSHY